MKSLSTSRSATASWTLRSSAHHRYRTGDETRNDDSTLEDFAKEEILELDPLPCWVVEGVSIEERQERIAEMVDHIADEAVTRHRAEGTRLSVPEAFLHVLPHQR